VDGAVPGDGQHRGSRGPRVRSAAIAIECDESVRDLPGISRRMAGRELVAEVKAGWTPLLVRPSPAVPGRLQPGIDRRSDRRGRAAC
jgi:hypothetical protein